MIRYMVPDMYYPSIYAIDLSLLKKKGIKSLIVDLDNTLVEATRPNATPKLIEWLSMVRKHGFRMMIVSNNTKMRVSQFAHPLKIPYIHTAKKPLSQAFRRALEILGTKAEETAVIGDQLLTDVLGGNRMGLHTILVVPISEVEGLFTRINRRIEKLVFRWMKKRGILSWEELR